MKSFIAGVVQRFNALPTVEKIRAHLNAAAALKGAGRERAMQEVARLTALQHAEKEAVQGLMEPAPAPAALTPAQEGFRRHAEAIAAGEAPSTKPVRGFVERTCAHAGCGEPFFTTASSVRVTCNACAVKGWVK